MPGDLVLRERPREEPRPAERGDRHDREEHAEPPDRPDVDLSIVVLQRGRPLRVRAHDPSGAAGAGKAARPPANARKRRENQYSQTPPTPSGAMRSATATPSSRLKFGATNQKSSTRRMKR